MMVLQSNFRSKLFRTGFSVLCCAVLVAILAGCSSSSSRQRHFRGEIPESLMNVNTDVSSAQALRANDVKIPAGISDFRYDANDDSGYIMDVEFRVTCSKIPSFLRGNNLSVDHDPDLIDSDAGYFAMKAGWNAPDPLARVYIRNDKYGKLSSLVTGRSSCRVYLSLDGSSQLLVRQL